MNLPIGTINLTNWVVIRSLYTLSINETEIEPSTYLVQKNPSVCIALYFVILPCLRNIIVDVERN